MGPWLLEPSARALPLSSDYGIEREPVGRIFAECENRTRKVAGLGTDNLSRCEDELVAMSCDLCIWINLQPNNLFVDTPSVTF